MKRINLLIVAFIWLLCTANQCNKENCHKAIEFVNNSSKDIYTCAFIPRKEADTLEFYIWFPNLARNSHMYKVKSREQSNNALWSRDCFNSAVKYSQLVVYIFDADILETIPWDTVGKYYMVLKTIRPTLEDMERDNWTITFTGE
jgi:hypothetical protein